MTRALNVTSRKDSGRRAGLFPVGGRKLSLQFSWGPQRPALLLTPAGMVGQGLREWRARGDELSSSSTRCCPRSAHVGVALCCCHIASLHPEGPARQQSRAGASVQPVGRCVEGSGSGWQVVCRGHPKALEERGLC